MLKLFVSQKNNNTLTLKKNVYLMGVSFEICVLFCVYMTLTILNTWMFTCVETPLRRCSFDLSLPFRSVCPLLHFAS